MLSYLENPSLNVSVQEEIYKMADVEEAGDKLKLTLL